MKKRILVITTALVLIFCLVLSASAFNKGDVDNNGKVDVGDARLCLRQAVQLDKCEKGDDVWKACDVDRNDKIDVGDARVILRVAVGLDKPFTEDVEETTAPEETTVPEETTTAAPEETTTVHTHSWDKGTVTKAATCSATGVRTYKCACGETKTEIIAKNPDAHSYKTVNVAATCAEEGYTGKKCELCGNLVKETTIPADEDAHDYKTVVTPESCLMEGYSIDTCTVCGITNPDTYVKGNDAIGHNFKEESTPATCTEAAKITKTCQREECGAVEISADESNPALGHKYKYTVITAATCTTEGKRSGECSVCADKITEIVPMVNHVMGTKNNRGQSGNACTTDYYCKVCNTVFRTTENTGHTLKVSKTVVATCTTPTTQYRECRYCTYTDVVDNDDTLGHDTTIAESVVATCTTDGYVVYAGSCSRCGEEFGDSAKIVLPAKGHKTKDGAVATCTDDVKCSRCNEVVEEALGHDYSIAETGLGSGAEYFFCSRCGELRADILAAFNKNVNLIKRNNYISTNGHSITWLDKQVLNTTYTKFDFGMYTSTVKQLYEEEMTGDSVEYTPLYENDNKYYNLQARYKSYVSELEQSDIDGITVERLGTISGNQILSGFDTEYTVGSKTYNIASLKTNTDLANGKGVIKVTVDVKDETLKKSGGNVSLDQNERTSLMKAFNYDVREELKEYDSNWQLVQSEGSSADGYEIRMDMTLDSAKTNGTIVFYFNASTMEPIAASYTVARALDQAVNMKFSIGVMTINGVIEPVITTTDNFVYIFK